MLELWIKARDGSTSSDVAWKYLPKAGNPRALPGWRWEPRLNAQLPSLRQHFGGGILARGMRIWKWAHWSQPRLYPSRVCKKATCSVNPVTGIQANVGQWSIVEARTKSKSVHNLCSEFVGEAAAKIITETAQNLKSPANDTQKDATYKPTEWWCWMKFCQSEYPIIMARQCFGNKCQDDDGGDGLGTGCIPEPNFRTLAEFEKAWSFLQKQASVTGVNLIVNKSNYKLRDQLNLFAIYKVPFIITSLAARKGNHCMPTGWHESF